MTRTCRALASARRRITLVIACLAGFVFAEVADAQVVINGGLGWSGGYDIGRSSAQLRPNAPGATAPPFTLFNVDSRIAPSPGGEVRVGVAIAPRFSVEGGVLLTNRRLAFAVRGDPESAAQQLDGETLHQYIFDAGVTWELPILRRSRARTFASGGAGYLRQLHQDRTLVETGQVYYVGGGARYWLRGRPTSSRSLGIRGDLRLNVRRRGIDFEDLARTYPTVSLLMFVGL
jgi:hypothetical protein